jgi:hypothetical protein
MDNGDTRYDNRENTENAELEKIITGPIAN